MTINNAVLKNCLKLSSKITVYVPATNGIDKAADNTEQVKKTAALLSELFGGATSTPALGYWMSPAAGLVAEATTVVFAYAADAALQEHVGRVVELCEELKREMGQEAIALEINGRTAGEGYGSRSLFCKRERRENSRRFFYGLG